MAEGDKTTSALNQRDLRLELDALEGRIADLKVQYEQYFSGILPLPPDKLHNEIKRTIRQLTSAPFRSSEINYRLRAIKGRYLSFDEYFQRVMKQREEGSYHRDVFKADLRERIQEEERFNKTDEGAAASGVRALFDTYKQALEKQTGKTHELDFKAFQQSLVKRAKELKEQHGVKKLTFKVVVKNGKVSVQAKSLD
jgi:hypothetical protein